jgi:hypothetical protein
MFDNLKRLLGADTTSSSSIEAALAGIDMPALHEARSRASAERQGLLLTGTTDEILAAERRLDEARLDVERAEAATEVLRAKLETAKAREIEEEYLAAQAAVVEARAAWADKVRRELPKVEKTVNAIFNEGEEVTRQIRALAKLRRPHDFTGNVVDQQPDVPLPYAEFSHRGPYGEKPVADWLMGLMQRNLPQI